MVSLFVTIVLIEHYAFCTVFKYETICKHLTCARNLKLSLTGEIKT